MKILQEKHVMYIPTWEDEKPKKQKKNVGKAKLTESFIFEQFSWGH